MKGSPTSSTKEGERAGSRQPIALHAEDEVFPAPSADGEEPARVLIVDDEPINRRLLAKHLSACGYSLATAAGGEEALQLLEQHPFDLVLLDVMMPGLSGYEVCRRIREGKPIQELPVLFLTAKTEVGDLLTGFDSGGNDYIGKPVARAELLARVRTHLDLLFANRGLRKLLKERTAQILERERLIRELEAANLELQRFTYTVSHDLKSPLITIRGFLTLLRKNADCNQWEAMQRDIDQIESAALSMQGLLEGLLELSRVGRVAASPQEVPLRTLVDEALSLLAGPIDRRQVEIEVSSDLPIVFGDRIRLLQVLQNLIDNAVKFMGAQNRPRIEIKPLRRGDYDGCCISDNGPGIAPRNREKVFGLFHRLNPDQEGTGIGLALVKRIVDVHKGRVWVEKPKGGQGAAFCFLLPKPPGHTDASIG